jgi:hypothetical protein
MGQQNEQRLTPREPVGWIARYLVIARPGGGWHDCRVIDVSHSGAALELFGFAPRKLTDLRVELRRTGPDHFGLQLHGEMRSMGPGTTKSGLRVGIEWRELSRSEREQLTQLLAPAFLTASG